MTALEQLKKLTGESDEELLSLLLENSADAILGFTNRKLLPLNLVKTQIKWALITYNRMGMEGESSRNEGAISQSFIEIPEEILSVLKNNRLARIGGKVYEKTQV